MDPIRLGSARCCRHCPTDTYHWYKRHFEIVVAPGINTACSLWSIILVGAQNSSFMALTTCAVGRLGAWATCPTCRLIQRHNDNERARISVIIITETIISHRIPVRPALAPHMVYPLCPPSTLPSTTGGSRACSTSSALTGPELFHSDSLL